jgi:hypothetical protein
MNKDICMLSLDRLSVQLSINVKADVIKRVDDERGEQSRSGFIKDCIVEHFTPTGEVDAKTIAKLEGEVAYLRDTNTRLLDAVSQKLLTPVEPKKSLWQRLRGH